MKTHPFSHKTGFTLIELLIVITIIAVLVGMALPAINAVLRKSKENQARAAAHGLVVAVKAYQTEYSRLPDPNATNSTDDATIITDSSNDMIATLLGKNTTYNPREIAFYDPSVAKNEANGLITDSGKYELVDPWSRPSARQYYTMTLDYGGDRSLDNPVKTTKPASGENFNAAYLAAEQDELSTEVVVYSDNDPRSSASRKPITSW